ncbi:MAG: hypothetical protein HFJ54_02450 [Clostridia bacterium]|nr:hypothetical protein [Clostridia bacterium]
MEGETLTTIVGILLAAILIGIFPMMSIAERTDDISQLTVQTAISEFVNTVRKTGKITVESYDKLVADLGATGNTYDITMEAQILDENPSKKTTQADETKIGENIYYSVYTTQILDKLDTSNKYVLKEGDIVTVSASNTNSTISQMLKNFFYSLSGNNTYRIVGSQSGVVTVTGS